ncbi:MAG: CoA-binding protein [Leptospiraceae bacterium]|nr:CoA-binding protein [Leptospiraceae bacterium]NUM41797.1 CoA-binding protein [Leptospiraceae bacterium]
MENVVLEKLKKKDLKIFLIGATNDKTKYGNTIYRDLKSKNIEVYGINPKATTIENDKAYHTIHEPNVKPDILNFVVPPKIGIEIIRDAINSGFDNFWLQPGAESEEIISLLEANKKNYLAHSCVMVQTR